MKPDANTILLGKLIRALDALQATIQDYTEAIRKQNETTSRKDEPHPPPTIQAALSLPIEVTEYYKTKSSQNLSAEPTRADPIKNISEIAAVITAVVLVCITNKTLREVKRQTDSAQKQLEATDRAWIKVSLSPDNPITYTDTGGAEFSLAVGMRNVGRSVATDCVIKFRVLAPKGKEALTEPIKQQIVVCGTPPNSVVKNSDDPIKTTVFPNDEERLGIGGNITTGDIKNASLPDSGPLKGKFFAPYVVGCVDYGFANTSKHHQTGFIYQIMRIEPKYTPLALEIGKPLAAGRIHLERYVFGGNYAY